MVHVSITPEHLFSIGGFMITNTLLTAWLLVAGLSSGAYILSRRLSVETPGRIQIVAESAVEALFSFMSTFAPNRETAKKFFPFAATIFIFVLSANWVGILPGVGSIGFRAAGEEKEVFVPFFRSVFSDLNMTLALALIVMTAVQVVGVVSIGIGKHLGKFFNFHGFAHFFSGVLELVSEAAKIISFSFRLFGNVFAGEVLLIIISFLVPYIAPVPFLGLELFVGFIQALIFSVLAMLFLSASTVTHGEH